MKKLKTKALITLTIFSPLFANAWVKNDVPIDIGEIAHVLEEPEYTRAFRYGGLKYLFYKKGCAKQKEKMEMLDSYAQGFMVSLVPKYGRETKMRWDIAVEAGRTAFASTVYPNNRAPKTCKELGEMMFLDAIKFKKDTKQIQEEGL